MHEMTNETLVFRCEACNGAVPFVADSNNPLLRCECGTPVPMLQVRREIDIGFTWSQEKRTLKKQS